MFGDIKEELHEKEAELAVRCQELEHTQFSLVETKKVKKNNQFTYTCTCTIMSKLFAVFV